MTTIETVAWCTFWVWAITVLILVFWIIRNLYRKVDSYSKIIRSWERFWDEFTDSETLQQPKPPEKLVE
jgi:hypothetical protein